MSYSKIVLVGKRCSGKTTLFWNLQKRLNWPVFSVSQYLRDYIRTYQIGQQEVEAESVTITADLDKRIEALISGSNQVIIETRVLGKFKIELEGVIKVLLMAKDETRIKRSALREKIDETKAKNRLFKKEAEFLERMQRVYGFGDFFNPNFFDLVIETDYLSPEQITDQVVERIG